MQFSCCNANFSAHTKFSTISELRGSVMHQNSAIYSFKKKLFRHFVFSNYAICMVRPVGLDKLNSFINICNNACRYCLVQKLFSPIIGAGYNRLWNLPQSFSCPYLNTRRNKCFNKFSSKILHDVLVQQKTLYGSADTRSSCF